MAGQYVSADESRRRRDLFRALLAECRRTASFEFERLFENDYEVLVTDEATRTDGGRFRNAEVLTFDGDEISKVEVYYGWNVE
jgi:hypothetical protein